MSQECLAMLMNDDEPEESLLIWLVLSLDAMGHV